MKQSSVQKKEKNQSASLGKIALVVWLPILLIIIAYGIVFGISDMRSSDAYYAQQNGYQECNAAATKENAKDAEDVRNGLKPYTGMSVCQMPTGSRGTGMLGLPRFCKFGC